MAKTRSYVEDDDVEVIINDLIADKHFRNRTDAINRTFRELERNKNAQIEILKRKL